MARFGEDNLRTDTICDRIVTIVEKTKLQIVMEFPFHFFSFFCLYRFFSCPFFPNKISHIAFLVYGVYYWRPARQPVSLCLFKELSEVEGRSRPTRNLASLTPMQNRRPLLKWLLCKAFIWQSSQNDERGQTFHCFFAVPWSSTLSSFFHFLLVSPNKT